MGKPYRVFNIFLEPEIVQAVIECDHQKMIIDSL